MAPLSLEQALQLALTRHRAGQLAEAEAIYRQILAHHPNHADTRHLLGAIAVALGRWDQALELIGSAIALRPDVAVYHGNLGEAYRRLGRHEEAVGSLRQALALAPDSAEALNNLGCTLAALGRSEEAIERLNRAVALKPDYADAWGNLAKAYLDRGRSLESRAAGLSEAVAAARRAVQLQPDFGEAWHHLGCALADQGGWLESLVALRRSRELLPRSTEVLNNLGQALLELAQRGTGADLAFFAEAISCFRQIVAWNPMVAEAHANLGAALSETGQYEGALEAYRETLRIRPEFAEVHLNYALLLLQLERYAEGWLEHEWRWRCPHFLHRRRPFSAPVWDGRVDRSLTVLIHAEQGFGDTLQFFRYWPFVAERVGRVVIESHAELVRLLAGNVPPGIEVIAHRRLDVVGLPAFDTHLPMMSLPLTLNRFDPRDSLSPGAPAYLRADPGLRERWMTQLGPRRGLRVGLVGAGSPEHHHDYRRSIDAVHLAPLLEMPGIEFHSLQPGAAALAGLIDWTSALTDFAESAALVAELDLVIAVDTSIAHLAGAVGKPVWLLLPLVPDWRWGFVGESTPWYPSMRLFRQTVRGDWPGVIRRVLEELSRFSVPEGD